MAERRVDVVSPDGVRGTVPESQVGNLPDGARILTREELAEEQLDAEYAKKSTGQKVAGAAGFFGPVGWAASALGKGALPGQLDAYREGVASGASAGMYQAAVREATAAVEGEQAARAYADHQRTLQDAYSGTHAAGALVGMLAPALASGGTTAAAATPAGALGLAGGALEHGVTRALGGLAAKGALGRAATTGAAMAVRGAAEGAAYAGIEQAASSIVQNEPITGEKLYAAVGHGALLGGGLGAALGAGGSLVGSGARAAIGKALGRADGLESALKESALLKPGSLGSRAAGAEAKGISGVLADPSNAARGMAQEQAWKAVGAGFGLQTTRYAKEAARYFANGTKDLGEIAMRYGLLDMGEAAGSPMSAAWAAAKSGTPAEILPKAEVALDSVGEKIGAITDSSGAVVTRQEVLSAINSVADEYGKSAATRPVARSIRAFGTDLLDSLGLNGENGVASVQDALRERKAIDRLAFQDASTLDPKVALEAKRELRGKLETLISSVMDEASGRVPGELKAEYSKLKKDYHGLRILTEAAEDSAARASKGATLGLGEKFALAGAVASGHFASGPVLAVGGKLLRERGNAAAAAFLARAAERGSFEEVVRSFNAKIQKSAAGVLTEGASASKARPEAKPSSVAISRPIAAAGARDRRREEVQSTQTRAKEIVKWVGAHQTNPERVAAQVEEAAAIVGQAAGPSAAEAYTASTIRAINFIAAHIPVKERADPLDPRTVPPLSHDEATQLIQAAKYATKPETIFEDFGKGIITPVGLRAAKTLAADSFLEFQLDLQSHVERHMLANRKLTQSQRLRIDKLLGYPAGADLRPATIARRQALLADLPMNGPEGPPTAGPSGSAPLDMNIQQAGFDSIEARRTAV